MKSSGIRLLIILYAGDYREVCRRLASGQGETHHSHPYTLKAITELNEQLEEVSVLCCKSQEPYNEVVEKGFRVIGAGCDPYKHPQQTINQIEAYQPTHLVVRVPIPGIFRWAIRNQVRTLGILADSFLNTGLRNQVKNYWLARLLNHPVIEWVANHGVNSCQSLQKIGVDPNKIIPWDWPQANNPDAFSPKQSPSSPDRLNLIYVGSVSAAKGVGDILDAIAKLKHKPLSVSLKIAGKGATDHFLHYAKQLNIQDHVKFLGLIPYHEVIHFMRSADIVLVPSRHNYPEGLPRTIYDGLCSRTPLITSDHPMFQGNLEHEKSALIFPAGDSTAMAHCIERLQANTELYHRLSANACYAWRRLQIPVKWADLVQSWIHASPENRSWLFEHRLASDRYQLLSKP